METLKERNSVKLKTQHLVLMIHDSFVTGRVEHHTIALFRIETTWCPQVFRERVEIPNLKFCSSSSFKILLGEKQPDAQFKYPSSLILIDALDSILSEEDFHVRLREFVKLINEKSAPASFLCLFALCAKQYHLTLPLGVLSLDVWFVFRSWTLFRLFFMLLCFFQRVKRSITRSNRNSFQLSGRRQTRNPTRRRRTPASFMPAKVIL